VSFSAGLSHTHRSGTRSWQQPYSSCSNSRDDPEISILGTTKIASRARESKDDACSEFAQLLPIGSTHTTVTCFCTVSQLRGSGSNTADAVSMRQTSTLLCPS